MSQLAYSSVPEWARPTPAAPAPDVPAELDLTGSSYLLVGIGERGRAIVTGQRGELPAVPVDVIVADEVDGCLATVESAIAESTVGLRVVISGPAGACLRVRGVAVSAGLEDDEIQVNSCGAADIDVFCSHCGTVTTAQAAIDDVVECQGCCRNLLVYHHVSRRTGHHLGFMVDAETAQPAAGPSGHPNKEAAQ